MTTDSRPLMPVTPLFGRPEERYNWLITILEDSVAEAEAGQLSLGRVLNRLGEASYSLVFILLSLPFLQPISLGPLSTVGGLNFAALGWQLLRGQQRPWLPEKVNALTPSTRLWRMMLKTSLFVVKLSRWIARPRWQNWASGPAGERLGGGIVMTAGLLMSFPLVGVPFNNALPALAILFVAIGLLEKDGLMLLIACFWLLVTVGYFIFLVYAALFLGEQALFWFGGLQ